MITRLRRRLLDLFSGFHGGGALAPMTGEEFEALRLECLATGTPC